MPEAIATLYSELEQRGLKGRVVSVRRLQDLRQEIEGRHAMGLFDEEFYRENLTSFSFRPPDDLPEAASLIVIAVPRPQTRITFTRLGKKRALTLPPTYWRYSEIPKEIKALLSAWLAPRGYHVVSSRVPQKALAVRSGLADYGRNNITYVQGMGSFYQPTAFFSDLPCPDDDWRESQMMERCQECQVCVGKCPTGAIPSDRFLLHTERCLVYHNERPADHPFPAWIDPSAHNSVIGCMICQRCCPENKPFLRRFDGNEEFTAEETALLLRGAIAKQLPPSTTAKLQRLGLLDDLAILPRNLGVFFGGAE